MDISSILPLLMANGGDSSNKMATILSAMNGGGNSSGGGLDPSAILSMMNKGGSAGNNGAKQGDGDKGTGADDPLLNILKNRSSGGGSAMDMVSLMSALNKNKNNKPQPQGLKPVKQIVPNDIMGVMAKLLG